MIIEYIITSCDLYTITDLLRMEELSIAFRVCVQNDDDLPPVLDPSWTQPV